MEILKNMNLVYTQWHRCAFLHSLCGEQRKVERKEGILRWSGVKLSFSLEPYYPSEPSRPLRTEAVFFSPHEGGKQFVIKELFGMARDWDISLLNVIVALNRVDRKLLQKDMSVWKAGWPRNKFALHVSETEKSSQPVKDQISREVTCNYMHE